MQLLLLNRGGASFFMSNVITPTKEQYVEGKVVFTGIEKEENILNTTTTVLKSEYLAGGFLGDDETYLVLSHNPNAWAGELTDDIIYKMLRDPEIYKCFNVIRNGVLGDGVTFRPALNEPTAIDKPLEGEVEPPDRKKERLARDQQIETYNLAKRYADFATRAFDNLEIPLRDVLDDMLLALPYGNRVAEKVFEPKQDKDFNDKLFYFKRLKVKPRKATIFVTDKFGNLVGLKAYVKEKDENGTEVLKPKIIKKEKFAILTFGGKDGDPRGTSFLESAYTAYQLKMQLWPEYLRWLIYSAVPPIVGYTSNETDSRKVLRDGNGEIVTDKDGNPVFESDVGALLQALKQVRNASAIALPYGAQVDTLNSSVSGDPFKGFRDVLNAEIEMGLIHQTLATSDSRHNTRAASQTHISILDDLVWRIKGTVRDMVTGMVKHLMQVNFPNFDESLTPIVTMGDTARREFAGDVGAISQLHISGFLGESQKRGIDDILGLPPRDVYSDREFERQKALEQMRLEARLQELTNPSPQPETTSAPRRTPAGNSNGNGDN
jgi:hypothetical protein